MSRRPTSAATAPTTERTASRGGPGRLSAAAAAEIPDRLLDAAFELFVEVGYGDATMDQIARRAGASTKTLYSRFANKGEMLEGVVRRNVERAIAAHVRALQIDPLATELRAFLLALGRQIAGATDRETAGMTRVTFAEAHRFPVLRRLYEEVNGQAVDAIRRALMHWVEEGAVTLVDDPLEAAELCYAMMTARPRVLGVLGAPMSKIEIDRHVAMAVDTLLRSCSYSPAKA